MHELGEADLRLPDKRWEATLSKRGLGKLRAARQALPFAASEISTGRVGAHYREGDASVFASIEFPSASAQVLAKVEAALEAATPGEVASMRRAGLSPELLSALAPIEGVVPDVGETALFCECEEFDCGLGAPCRHLRHLASRWLTTLETKPALALAVRGLFAPLVFLQKGLYWGEGETEGALTLWDALSRYASVVENELALGYEPSPYALPAVAFEERFAAFRRSYFREPHFPAARKHAPARRKKRFERLTALTTMRRAAESTPFEPEALAKVYAASPALAAPATLYADALLGGARLANDMGSVRLSEAALKLIELPLEAKAFMTPALAFWKSALDEAAALAAADALALLHVVGAAGDVNAASRLLSVPLPGLSETREALMRLAREVQRTPSIALPTLAGVTAPAQLAAAALLTAISALEKALWDANADEAAPEAATLEAPQDLWEAALSCDEALPSAASLSVTLQRATQLTALGFAATPWHIRFQESARTVGADIRLGELAWEAIEPGGPEYALAQDLRRLLASLWEGASALVPGAEPMLCVGASRHFPQLWRALTALGVADAPEHPQEAGTAFSADPATPEALEGVDAIDALVESEATNSTDAPEVFVATAPEDPAAPISDTLERDAPFSSLEPSAKADETTLEPGLTLLADIEAMEDGDTLEVPRQTKRRRTAKSEDEASLTRAIPTSATGTLELFS